MLERLADGAILLDGTTGALFQLNGTAAFVWTGLLAGRAEGEIVSEFAAYFSVPESVARRDVAMALSPTGGAGILPLQTESHYELVDDRYRFSVRGVPVIEVMTSARSVRTLRDLTPSELYFHFKAISPKLMALLGSPVLHASAVRLADAKVLAFLGESGAGKTTTARAFAAAGLELVCEDKLILRRQDDGFVAVLAGEQKINDWLSELSGRLRSNDVGRWCELGSLETAAEGDVAALSAVVAIAADRRTGTQLQLEPLGQSAAASQVFQHAFYGSFAVGDWARYVAVAAAVARTTPAFRGTVPNGREQLSEAVRRYTEKTQS